MNANQAAFVEGKTGERSKMIFYLLIYFYGRSIRTKIPSFREFGMNEIEKRDYERKQKIKRYADQRVKAAPSDVAVGDKVKSVQSALSDLKRPPERLQSQCNYRPFIT